MLDLNARVVARVLVRQHWREIPATVIGRTREASPHYDVMADDRKVYNNLAEDQLNPVPAKLQIAWGSRHG